MQNFCTVRENSRDELTDPGFVPEKRAGAPVPSPSPIR